MDVDSWQFGLLFFWGFMAAIGVISAAVAMTIDAHHGMTADEARTNFKIMGASILWPLALVVLLFLGVFKGALIIIKDRKYR